MSAATEHSAVRHPWLDVFAADPVQGVGDLLAGYAPVYPYTRADAPDAARMLFGVLPADDPARIALSDGVLGWLNETRRAGLPADPAALQDRVRAVSEAFEIVALLRVAPAAAALRREYPRWAEWTAQMALAPSRDAQEAYLRMLSQTQGAVAGATTNPDALAPLWMRLCREAGARFPIGACRSGCWDCGGCRTPRSAATFRGSRASPPGRWPATRRTSSSCASGGRSDGSTRPRPPDCAGRS